jgi:hypothetical protein
MKKNKKIISYIFSASILACVIIVSVIGYKNSASGFFYSTGGDLSSFNKELVIAKIKSELYYVNNRLSNNILSKLSYLPVDLRAKTIAADESLRNNLSYLDADIESKTSDQDIYNVVSQYESEKNLEYFSRVQRQNISLLQNYNRLYLALQDTYTSINDVILYIDTYGGAIEGDTEAIKTNLQNMKNTDLVSFENSIDNKMGTLESKDFGGTTGISRTSLQDLEQEILKGLNTDFLVHRLNYNNIKSSVDSDINSLLIMAGYGSVDELPPFDMPLPPNGSPGFPMPPPDDGGGGENILY